MTKSGIIQSLLTGAGITMLAIGLSRENPESLEARLHEEPTPISIPYHASSPEPKPQIRNIETSQQESSRKPLEKKLIDYYTDAAIQIESHGNPNATKYEEEMNDVSIGLGQILTRVADAMEDKYSDLPRLRDTKEGLIEDLKNPEINRAYTQRQIKENLEFYDGNVQLAIAAYNSGKVKPRNARIQQQLNDLYDLSIRTNGRLKDAPSIIALKRFQKEYGLKVDGKFGANTNKKLQEVWTQNFPGQENPKGIIPTNTYTPNHVRKFNEALKEIMPYTNTSQ